MRRLLSVLWLAAAPVVSGCTLLNDDTLVSSPGRFDGYRCDTMHEHYDKATKRERELVEAMARASSDPAGGVINTLVYASPLASERGDIRRLEEAAARSNCDLRTGKIN